MNDIDSRISETPPKKILCQGENGGCASCCGVFNDMDRKNTQWENKIKERTQHVVEANFDVTKLMQIKTEFLQKHAKDKIYDNIRVCPFAGFIETDRLGCLIHPSRHPQKYDLRDLSVHNQKICDGHFCASHDWLRPTEVAFINTAHGTFYGLLVSQPGLVKQLRQCLEACLGRSLSEDDFMSQPEAFKQFWLAIERWPHLDLNPQRFGGFVFIGRDANAESVSWPKEWFPATTPKYWVQALKELESDIRNEQDAQRALKTLLDIAENIVAKLH